MVAAEATATPASAEANPDEPEVDYEVADQPEIPP
jgi:hypothetical protein